MERQNHWVGIRKIVFQRSIFSFHVHFVISTPRNVNIGPVRRYLDRSGAGRGASALENRVVRQLEEAQVKQKNRVRCASKV